MSKAALIGIVVFTLLFSVFALAMGQSEQFLVGYWPFDEGTGNVTGDASGNGNDGELIDNPAWVLGKFGSALEFAGGNYVNVPDSDSLDLTDAATVTCWFKLTAGLTETTRMISKNNSIFVMFDFGDKATLDLLIKPNNDFVESTTTDWVIGEWYHFAGTYNGDALRIYINGVLEGESTGVPPIATSDLELWIGADDWQLPNSSFAGAIDDVRFYSAPLAEDEIGALMEGVAAVQMSEDKLPITWGLLKAAH
ncbi:MAG: LamG domain-containing protein [bacterium]